MVFHAEALNPWWASGLIWLAWWMVTFWNRRIFWPRTRAPVSKSPAYPWCLIVWVVPFRCPNANQFPSSTCNMSSIDTCFLHETRGILHVFMTRDLVESRLAGHFSETEMQRRFCLKRSREKWIPSAASCRFSEFSGRFDRLQMAVSMGKTMIV